MRRKKNRRRAVLDQVQTTRDFEKHATNPGIAPARRFSVAPMMDGTDRQKNHQLHQAFSVGQIRRVGRMYDFRQSAIRFAMFGRVPIMRATPSPA